MLQGSNLGPILFLCYINDLWKCTTLFSILFADDTTCLARGQRLLELIAYVNAELQKIANWLRANKMALNTGKTKYIIFRTQGKKIDEQDCVVTFNDNEIGKPENPNIVYPIQRIYNGGTETSFKLLGVHFDEYLTFDVHIDGICTKIAKSLFCINRVKNFLDHSSLRKLYFSMVHSHIDYCLSIYGCANPTSLNKLKVKQKMALRTITNSAYRAHTAPLFIELKILPLEQQITYARLKFMHKFHHGNLPPSFFEHWTTNRVRNPERELRNANDLTIIHHNYATLKRLPIYSFPVNWNSENEAKLNPIEHQYMKNVKNRLLAEIR